MKTLPAGLTGINLARRQLLRSAAPVLFGIIGAAFGLISLSAYIIQSMRSHLVPYVVTVDQQGLVLARGELELDYALPPAAAASEIGQFICDLRTVSPDQDLQRRMILRAYAHVLPDSSAKSMLDRHFKDFNPFTRGQKERVSCAVVSVIVQSPHTLQIDWHEEQHFTQGLSRRRPLRALVTFKHEVLSQDQRALMLNPLSIYISDFSVSEVMQDIPEAGRTDTLSNHPET